MTPDPSMMMAGGGGPDLSLMQVAVYGFLFMILVLLLLTLVAVASLPVFFGALAGMNSGLTFGEMSAKGRFWVRLGVFNAGGLTAQLFGFGLQEMFPDVGTLPRVGIKFLIGGCMLIAFEMFQVLLSVIDPQGKWRQLALLVFRSLRRNLLRTALTYVALFVLTGMLTFIYAIVKNLGDLTADKEGSQLVIMTEKFAIPSQMPPGHATRLRGLIQDRLPKDLQPADLDKNFMTWTFVGAAIDPTKSNPENNFFLFSLDPNAIPNGMMKEQGLSREDLGDEDWEKLLAVVAEVNKDKRYIVIGEDRLKVLNKKVGETLKFTGTNYRELEFDCLIVGAFPSGSRLGNAAAMRYDFLQAKMDEYKRVKGKDHPLAGSALNLIWVRLPNKQAFEQLAQEVAKPDSFPDRAAKLETFSAAIGTFLEPFKDIFWGMKYIVMPAIVVIMCLVIGITITIGVRERRAEMAVLKVLGFQPRQVQVMVVAESVLIGVYGGLLATWTVYFLPLVISAAAKMGGGKIAFFDSFKSDPLILLYGPLLGIAVGLIGAWMPSRAASKVKVSEVFAQVA